MTTRTDLLERNGAFAADFTGGELPIQPRYRQLVLSCVDARTDPAHYLGLEPGDALVMRTLGGRVTDGAEQDIAVLANLMTVIKGPDEPNGLGLDVLIVHHTDCGLERLADGGRRTKLSQISGIDEGVFDALAIHNHKAALEADVRRLRNSKIVPESVTVSGYLYHHSTGTLAEVHPAD